MNTGFNHLTATRSIAGEEMNGRVVDTKPIRMLRKKYFSGKEADAFC